MSAEELAIGASTIWVVIAAVLVMFMQAGFAFLEAGLTRMKNVGHIAAKNALVLGLASLVYYLVGFGIAFGDGGNGLFGGSGFVPSVDELLAVGAAPFSWFGSIPGAAGYLFEVVFAPCRSRSSGARWPSGRASGSTSPSASPSCSSTPSSRTGSGAPTAGCSASGCRTSPARRSSTTRARSPASPARSCSGPRIGKFNADGKPNAIPGHNMAYTTLGVLILWFGWFGFNPGSTLERRLRRRRLLRLRRAEHEPRGRRRCPRRARDVVDHVKKPDLSMMLNGAIAALVAITAACAFVAPWAAIVIGLVAGGIVVVGSLLVERLGIDDPIGALAAHGMAGVWGTLSLGFLTRSEPGGEARHRRAPGSSTAAGSTSSACRPLGLAAVGAFTFGASFLVLWAMKATVGIRAEPEVETAGLDVSEHGMWGYPEFYIPVPGGYGTDAHAHIGFSHAARSAPAPEPTPAPAPQSTSLPEPAPS